MPMYEYRLHDPATLSQIRGAGQRLKFGLQRGCTAARPRLCSRFGGEASVWERIQLGVGSFLFGDRESLNSVNTL